MSTATDRLLTVAQAADLLATSTTRAALIYQHGSAERDRLIADAVSKLAAAERDRSKSPSGTQRARTRKPAS